MASWVANEARSTHALGPLPRQSVADMCGREHAFGLASDPVSIRPAYLKLNQALPAEMEFSEPWV